MIAVPMKRANKNKSQSSLKRRVISVEDHQENTPVSALINFGPVTLPEIESLGFRTLGDLREAGWEDVCRRWAESFPERLNVNAFIGIIATLDGIVWTRISPSQRTLARNLVRKMKIELGIFRGKTKRSYE